MFTFIMVGMLGLIFALYLFLSPWDTFSELKVVFDPRVIRRGLRFRFPRRIRMPSISLPPIRFSILGLLVMTAVVAAYIGFMQAENEPLVNAVIMAVVVILLTVVSILVGWNAQGRGVLRKQRAKYLPDDQVSKQSMPAIQTDSVHKTIVFRGKSFPRLQSNDEGLDEMSATADQ